MITSTDFINQLPRIAASTLSAIKKLPLLERYIQQFLDSDQGEDAFKALEDSARPLLLDAGTGKKGTADVLSAWKKVATTPNVAEDSTKSSEPPSGANSAAAGAINATHKSNPNAKLSLADKKRRRELEKQSKALGAIPSEAIAATVAAGGEIPLNATLITATSQESRFYLESISTATKEIDLKDVNLAVGERHLLVDAHLRVKEGIKYGFVAPNGSGKSTLLRALADNLIPGLPPSVRILLVSQLDSENVVLEARRDGETASVLETVLRSDAQRLRAERESEELGAVIDTGDTTTISASVTRILLRRAQEDLAEAQRISLKRSGARGADARKALIAAEQRLEEAKQAHSNGEQDQTRDWQAEAAAIQAEALALLEELEASTARARSTTILNGLGFSAAQIAAPYTSLSGGWRSRVSLASALLKSTDILLLDEPVNFLDLPSLLWLQGFIRELPSTVITVAHDREFLDAVTDELIIVRKQKLLYFDGNLTDYEREHRRAYNLATRQQEVLDKKREQLVKTIAQANRTAAKTGDDNRQRLAKSRQKKLDERWGLERNAAGHRFKLNRDLGGYYLTSRAGPEIDAPDSIASWRFPQPAEMRFPGALAHLENATFCYPDAKKPTVRDVSLTIERGERVALVGPNGHGKTTIVQLILGNASPTTGLLEHHPRIKIGYYVQHTVASFSTEKRTALTHLLEYTSQPGQGPVATESEARGLLGRMGLSARTADSMPVRSLSGGQKVRLGLAEVMSAAPDLVVLDEVTTHLDSDSITALIYALEEFEGAVLLVSHDRHAVKRIVEFEPEPTVDSDDDEQGRAPGSVEDAAELKAPGRVYLVQDGRCKLLEGGMDTYTRQVERSIK